MTEMNGIARNDLERLSAFLDGELSPAESEQLEARLATDQQLSEALEALRATSEIVASLPEVRPPRSFALTQDMVRPRRAYPILQLGTAMAALGFVLVVGADLLLSNAASSSVQAPEQALIAADRLAEQQVGDAAPAEAPVAEDAVVQESEMEMALPETEDAEDGLAQESFRSEEEAAAGEPAVAESEADGEADVLEEGSAEPAAGGEAEFAGESEVVQEAASGAESPEPEALKAAADEDLSAERLAANELDVADEDPSVPLSLLRVIEIGLGAVVIVLIGLTLWVRQRG